MLVLEKNEILPKGWEYAKIADLVIDPKQEIVDGPFGSNLKATEYVEKGIPLIRLQNVSRNLFVDKNIKYVTKEKATHLKRHNFKNNDVVITKLGAPLGEACLVPEYFSNGIIVADIVRIRLTHELISKKFLMYQINSNKIINQFKKYTKGTTRPRVNLKQIRDFNVVIPPLNEQIKIVIKIEELFSKLDFIETSILKVKLHLIQLKNSLLRSTFEQKYVSNLQTGKLVDFCKKITDGEHFKPNYVPNGIPFLTAKNVRDNGVEFNDVEFITDTDAIKSRNRCNPEKNDILMVSRGATIGRTCLINTDRKFCLLGSVILIKPDDDVTSKFLLYFLKSPHLQKQLIAVSGSTAQQAIYLRDIGNILISFPAITEQIQIISQLELQLTLIENNQNMVNATLKIIEDTRNVILKQAFEGKLLPQDPNDEPASELLKKIKAQK